MGLSMFFAPIKILIKYCGGCNPTLDRVKTVKILLHKLKDKVQVVSKDDDIIDVMLIVCGCPTACIDTSELTEKTVFKIVINGLGVDYTQMDETEISDFVTQKIESLIEKNITKYNK